VEGAKEVCTSCTRTPGVSAATNAIARHARLNMCALLEYQAQPTPMLFDGQFTK
jgi:hypothetical protein